MSVTLSIKPQPTSDLAFKNCAFVHPSDYERLLRLPEGALAEVRNAPRSQGALRQMYVTVMGKHFTVRTLDSVEAGSIALSMLQRTFAAAMLDAMAEVKPFVPTLQEHPAGEIKFKAALLRTRAPTPSAGGAPVFVAEAEEMEKELAELLGTQILTTGQRLAYMHKGSTPLTLEVIQVQRVESPASKGGMFGSGTEYGLYLPGITKLAYGKSEGIQIKGLAQPKAVNKMLDVNFEALGIGGLDKEFSQIFRRAFASRVYPSAMVKAMGINHVRGMMLFGPPGCGKTLIARQISKALQGGSEDGEKREPKVVNGPEILSKFVGESESNIRALFADAEAEQLAKGDESELHVIIFDEFDAIAKKRGSTRDGTGVHDSLVNQLLSKIDGVDSLHNILLIGMTNRLDMMDPALLRPGRFEVQVEISLPDEEGRVQILNIHTGKMRAAGYLSDDVDLNKLSEMTKNFTGAEIEGLVKSAGSWAFQRQVDTSDIRKVVDPKSLRVTMSDFEQALAECHPMFGAADAEDELKRQFAAGIIPFSPHFENTQRLLQDLTQKTRLSNSEQLALVSVLITGQPGAGKTALAAKIAHDSGFPLVRVLTPDKYIGMSEQTKSAALADAFDEAYKSSASLILIEDLERIIDFSRVGNRFSNQVLQSLLILIRRPPPKDGRKLMIIATTSVPDLIEPLDLVSVFNTVVTVPQVETREEVAVVARHVAARRKDGAGSDPFEEEEIEAIADSCPLPISVKKLVLALEMSRGEEDQRLTRLSFREFMVSTREPVRNFA